MDDGHSHLFDEIHVATRSGPPRRLLQSNLSFDKRGVYAGPRANFRLKFKDVDVITSSITARDGDRGRHARGRGGEAVTLALRGKKGTMTCTVRTGGTTAGEAHALEAFVAKVQDAHRAQTLKRGGKDPYAVDHTKKKGGSRGSSRNGVKSSGGGKPSRGTVTPAASARGVFLSPTKKRGASARSFQSPGRTRGAEDEDRRGSSDQYAHYDPALSHSSAAPKSPSHFTKNNVVTEPAESPAARKLKLPPKSPRNATPTKVRFVGARGHKGEEKLRSITNRLNGRGGGEMKLREPHVQFDLDVDGDDLSERRPTPNEADEKGKEGDAQGGGSKRRRLQKAGGGEGDATDHDSDVEFDDANAAGAAPPPSSCKKRLKLTIDDGSDAEADEEKPAPAPKTTVEAKAPQKAPPSPSPASVADILEHAPGQPSTADRALSPQKSAAKPGTLPRFFAKRPPPGAARKVPSKSEAPRPSPPGSGTPSTPAKKPRSVAAPATPPRPSSAKATPVVRQTQRKKSAYFDEPRSAAAENIGSKELKYSSEEDDIIPGYGANDEYYDGGEDGAAKENEWEEDTATKTSFERAMQGRRGAYGRLGRSRLGQSRLAQPRRANVATSSEKRRVDLSGVKATAASKRGLGPGFRNAFGQRVGTPPPLSRIDDEKDAPSAPRIPGVQNLGNTCYLSASLQALFSVPDFVAGLYKTYADEVTQTPAKKMPLTKSLLEVAAAIGVLKEEECPLIDAEEAKSQLTTSKAGNPASLKRQMDARTDKFAGYEQRDAHEFLGDLVDFLHDELAASPDKSGASADGKSVGKEDTSNEDGGAGESEGNAQAASSQKERGGLPTDDFFHLNVRVCLECDSCGYSRSKDEMYRHLSVDVGEGDSENDQWTVERSLRQFFQPEKRELKCEKCEAGKTATQTMEITSCPKALLLHFKRFIVTQEAKTSPKGDGQDNTAVPPPVMEMVLRKNKAKVPLEESLSINPFVGKDEEGPAGKYHLRGVVHHVGSTACSGHYTACAKRTLPNKQGDNEKKSDSQDATDNGEHWVFFDDRVGAQKDLDYVTGSERNQRNCYMALYELK